MLAVFPFSDLTQSKVRPAVCIADADRGDWLLCQITSNPYGDARALQLDPDDFATGGLARASYVRPGKLFTAHHRLVVRSVGRLNDATFDRVVAAIIEFIRPAPTS